jgi:hypothetical protein
MTKAHILKSIRTALSATALSATALSADRLGVDLLQVTIDKETRLVLEGSAIEDAMKKARQGNTVPLFSLVRSFCSLSDEEKIDFQHGLFEYRDPDAVRRAEKLLIAYRRGSLVKGDWKPEAANEQVRKEFGRKRSLILRAVQIHRSRGGVFSR